MATSHEKLNSIARQLCPAISLSGGARTGTAVGDSAELGALGKAIRESGDDTPPAAIGSIKANIGHTKAAAGVAGFIKAAMAVNAPDLAPYDGLLGASHRADR